MKGNNSASNNMRSVTGIKAAKEKAVQAMQNGRSKSVHQAIRSGSRLEVQFSIQ